MFIASAQRRYGDNPSRVVIRQRRIDRVRVRHAVPLLCTLVRDIPNGNSLILGLGRNAGGLPSQFIFSNSRKRRQIYYMAIWNITQWNIKI